MGKISLNELNTDLGTKISKIGTGTLTTTAQDLSGAVNEVNTTVTAHLADEAQYRINQRRRRIMGVRY